MDVSTPFPIKHGRESKRNKTNPIEAQSKGAASKAIKYIVSPDASKVADDLMCPIAAGTSKSTRDASNVGRWFVP